MNWYEVLGVSPDASLVEIRQAHRSIVRASHPDVLGHREHEAELRLANAAWAVLSDPQRRASFDLALQRGIATAEPADPKRFVVSDDDLIRVITRTKATQDQRTKEMVRIGIIGVVICLVLLIFLSGMGATP
ncbi:J domain-containing protein [Stomatohabitans albus]|uniref:J domain-containing protein n=1 Tax=Stomatohabitans albus TaxID=3110766 RepID=UPI00300D9D46